MKDRVEGLSQLKSIVYKGHSSYGHRRFSEKLQFSNQTRNIDYRTVYPANLNCTTLAVVDTIRDKIPKVTEKSFHVGWL